jgi:hypothetical protein
MRRFTVTPIGYKPSLTVVADYMTRDPHHPNTLKFWVERKHWWQPDRLVGTFEAHAYTQCSSEDVASDDEFLIKAGVQP